MNVRDLEDTARVVRIGSGDILFKVGLKIRIGIVGSHDRSGEMFQLPRIGNVVRIRVNRGDIDGSQVDDVGERGYIIALVVVLGLEG